MTESAVRSNPSPSNEDHELGVLIADNGDFMRSLHEEILNTEFTVVGAATTGVEALELFQDQEPDVVFLSQDLPLKDGLDVAAELNTLDQHAGTIIHCMSPELSANTIASEIVDGIVTIPYQKPELIHEVKRVAEIQ